MFKNLSAGLALAGALLFAGGASAGPRPVWQFFADPPSPHAPVTTDDGGRAARWFGGALAGGSRVIAEATRFLGARNVTGTRGPWCADYASFVLKRTGHRPLASRMAASALAYGPRVRNPRPGDLIVLGGGGRASHVGFFAGWIRGRVVMVSGNWSHRVSRAEISPRAVIAFIRV